MGKAENFSLKRLLRYYYCRMVRSSGAPETIARGVGLGLAVGFIVPFGLQIAVGVPLALLIHASLPMTIAFTFVTNHFTIFLIYPVQCYIGSYMLFHPISYAELESAMGGFIHGGDGKAVLKLGWWIMGSFFAGGALFAALSAPWGYLWSLKLVRAYRERRRNKKTVDKTPGATILQDNSKQS